MTISIEVPNTIQFEALKSALAQIKTLSVTHVQTDSLHLKVDLRSFYPHDFYQAGNLLWLRFGPEMVESFENVSVALDSGWQEEDNTLLSLGWQLK